MTPARVAIATTLVGLSLAASGYADAKPRKETGPPAAERPATAPAAAERGASERGAQPDAGNGGAKSRGAGPGNGGPPGRGASGRGTRSAPTSARGDSTPATEASRAEAPSRGSDSPSTRSAPASRKDNPRSSRPATANAVEEPAAPAAVAPAPAVAPVTSAPAATTTPPATRTARDRNRQRPATRRRPRRTRTPATPTASAPAAAPVTAESGTPLVVAAAPEAEPTPTAQRQRAADRAQARSERPALTRLVTRIVEVIPRPVRLALIGLAALAAVLLLALLAAALRGRRLERQRRRLMADVGLLQSALLPELAPVVGPASVSAAYRPAEGLAAGGDFYDAFALDEDRTCVILGDVGGHGRDAIPVTALVRYTVRAYLEGGLAPRQALQVAGRVLEPQLRDTLVTVLVAVYDAQTGLLTVATAGHPPPVVTTDGAPRVMAFSSPAFGLGAPTGRRQVTLPLPPGAAACFYTDGLADVLVDGDRLGLDRLAREIRTLTPGEGASELIQRLVQRSDAQPDDMAAFVLRPPADAPAPRIGRIEELEIDARDVERGRLRRYLAAYGVAEGVTDGVADAATRAVEAALRRAHAVVIEINHDAAGATVSVKDSPDVVALPLVHFDEEIPEEELVARASR